jgi:hypothetical protein
VALCGGTHHLVVFCFVFIKSITFQAGRKGRSSPLPSPLVLEFTIFSLSKGLDVKPRVLRNGCRLFCWHLGDKDSEAGQNILY